MIRWFNEAIADVPVTLTLLVGGVIVIPAFIVVVVWLGLVAFIGAGQILGLRS